MVVIQSNANWAVQPVLAGEAMVQAVPVVLVEGAVDAALEAVWSDDAALPAVAPVAAGAERGAALGELEQAERNLPAPAPYLRFVKGYVLMTLELNSDALACLEAVLEEQAEFAPAYDLVAHNAFQSGDKIKGLRYAKEARMRGIYTEHRAWGSGAYSPRPKRV